ncbi:hypothetical protein, partial [[Ruminococcus] lactaris]|uniref:hypothetical protein n=1 Tax=[Ruminococcus] lactaris TaxID=46228 RepID=UPI002A0CFD35|nr:hypothetical protein [[Ruminococcus] lactaris]MCB5533842.1 hypothetical protein [[Ruminococcus] lactaris]
GFIRPARYFSNIQLSNSRLLQEANAAAEKLLLEDPDFSQKQHRKLKDHLQKKLKDLMLETTL